MSSNLTRRELIQRATLAGGLAALGGVWTDGASAQAPKSDQKLRIACIGVGGQGHSDLRNFMAEEVVALCDVDWDRAADAFKELPDVRKYKDYRVMLEKEAKNIDAVSVSTPDHSHAPASVLAMKLGKHVYCQKPLTHCVLEARIMRDVARQHKVVTQMGTQGHPNYVRLVEYVNANVVGPIREVHVWTDRPAGWWPQGMMEEPAAVEAVPANLDWNLWLGPAKWRPYNHAYMPFIWRGWWDFGTGALGDMACHLMDGAFWALKLGYPTAVWTEGDPLSKVAAPNWQTVHLEFPARGDMPACTLTWWDAKRKPPAELFKGYNADEVSNGSLFIGDKGTMLVPHGSDPICLPQESFKDVDVPMTLPRSPGHYIEWMRACKTGGLTGSNFDYASVMTESVLLGNVAFRVGKRLEWDAERMRAANAPEADQYLRAHYRRGWRL